MEYKDFNKVIIEIESSLDKQINFIRLHLKELKNQISSIEGLLSKIKQNDFYK